MEFIDISQWLRFGASLTLVLALMGGLALAMKYFGAGRGGTVLPSKRRLKIIEIMPLDAKRRMALIQRDNTQHLVILGPNGETVIETGIVPPAADAVKDEQDEKKAA